MKDKTVYVLGAGFSKEAGAPAQAGLIHEIFSLHAKNIKYFEPRTVEDFKDFLKKNLHIQDELHKDIPLEDVFTPLDRCLIDDVSFRGLNGSEITKVKSNLHYLIARTLDILLKTTQKNYIDEFAEFIVKKASVRRNHNYRKTDPVSVISMNWDILLDNSLKEALKKYPLNNLKVVDYCCYISSFEQQDETIKPGLEALGRGGFNVKLLKLHGSLNWLNCSNCKSLYIGFDEKLGLRGIVEGLPCRHCNENYPGENSRLVSNLVMPTFLKNLTSAQLKLIWQNAGVEFSEASRIVFIGYSLPQADFELRQLMARMVRKDAVIEVVDFGKNSESRIKDLKKRYDLFFGTRKPNYHLKGASNFISREIQR